MRRPTLGGLLGSSYRQHQESLAAERERRRLEREERLQRIEREERNRFKLVSLLLITPTMEKNKLSDSTSEQMYYVFLLDCWLLHSPKNRLAGMRLFFFKKQVSPILESAESFTKCFLTKANLPVLVSVPRSCLCRTFHSQAKMFIALKEKTEILSLVLRAVKSPSSSSPLLFFSLSRDYVEKREEARQAREERSVHFISALLHSSRRNVEIAKGRSNNSTQTRFGNELQM